MVYIIAHHVLIYTCPYSLQMIPWLSALMSDFFSTDKSLCKFLEQAYLHAVVEHPCHGPFIFCCPPPIVVWFPHMMGKWMQNTERVGERDGSFWMMLKGEAIYFCLLRSKLFFSRWTACLVSILMTATRIYYSPKQISLMWSKGQNLAVPDPDTGGDYAWLIFITLSVWAVLWSLFTLHYWKICFLKIWLCTKQWAQNIFTRLYQPFFYKRKYCVSCGKWAFPSVSTEHLPSSMMVIKCYYSLGSIGHKESIPFKSWWGKGTPICIVARIK